VALALLAHIIIIIFLFEQERIEARSEASFSQKKIFLLFFEQKGLKQDFIFSYFFFPPL